MILRRDFYVVGAGVLLWTAAVQAQADAPPRIDEIVITATRTAQSLDLVPVSIAVQSMDELRENGFTYGTDEFRGVTGVFFRRGEGDGDEFPFVSIRGSTGTEGSLALIDGVPFVGLDEETLLNQVPYDAVARVEILKGPASALYGRGALYGAVNYITRSPRADAATLAFSGGSNDYYRGEGTLTRTLGGRGGVFASASYETYKGWRTQSSKRLLNLFGKVEYDLTDRTTVTAYANYADRSSKVPNGLPVSFAGEVVEVAGGPEAFLGFGDPHNDQQGLIGQLKVEHRFSDSLSLTVTGQGRRFDQDLELNFYDPLGFDPSRHVHAVNGFRNDSRQDAYYVESTLKWARGRHSLIAGIAGESSTVNEDERWSGQFGFTPECGFAFFLVEIDYTTGQVVNRDHPCFEVELPYTKDRFKNTFWGAFIQDEIAVTEQVYLTVGGRYDSFKRTAVFDALPASSLGGTLTGQADAFSPKAAVSYRYGTGQIYASYGRGFNANFGPTFEWDAAQYARPVSKPSTLDSFELGWKGRAFGDVLRFETALFFTTQKNRRSIIPNPDAVADPLAPGSLITYGDRYESKGLEVGLNVRVTDTTTLTANYSYFDPTWKRYVISTFSGPVDLSGRTPVGVPRHIVYLAADQQFTPWLSGRAVLEIYDDYMVTTDNRVRGGGYELVSLNARIAPTSWSHMVLDLGVTNLLDKDYYYLFGGRTAPTTANPGAPRQFRATVRASF